MTVCTSCSARNAAGSRYCSSCGTSLLNPCPECGHFLSPDEPSCPVCGRRQGAPRAFLERKTVTVLFADVVGSTAVGERMDVESHQELMSAYFDAMRSEVEAAGGLVEQFVGDAVLAVFGVPIVGEDDADRAVEAADRMLDRLARFNGGRFARHGLHLEIRIGINTGEVVAPASGTVPLGELAGDTLNVASRLAGRAEPGSILVSGPTARMARRWRFTAVGSLDLRGRSVPISAFAVAGPSPRVGSGMSRAPMTGRAHEAALLESLLDRAGAEHRPRLVTVYGPAGIGKSRLTAEFASAASRRRPPCRVLFGRCSPYGEAVAFGALAEILASLAREGRPSAEPAEAVAALVDGLGAPGFSPPEGTAAALTYAAGIGDRSHFSDLPAPQVRSAIGGAWRWLLERLAAEQTLVVILEDMHWADPALLDVLERLADTVEGPVVFVCPARSGLLETRPSWGSGRANFTDVSLEPLTSSDGLDLIDWYLGPGVAAVIGKPIVDRAEGNPYFIEEIVRGLIDEGTVVKSDGEWTVVRDVGDLEIPATVQAVISARIDRLASPEKRVLQAASIIGRTFWADAVGHLLGADSTGVVQVLDALEERDLVLAGDAGEGGADEHSYRFRHALVRDVAYRTLSRRDRSRLHLAVAEWLRGGLESAPPEVIALEAHHLSMAFDGMRDAVAEDVDVEALRVRAMGALLAASDSALQKGAVGQAVYFARQARRHSRNALEASRAAEALGEAHFFAYQGDAAWRALKEAIDLRAEEEDPAGPDPEIARLCARALQLAVRWPGAMQARPDEVMVLRYLHLGMDHAPPRSEESIRLLTMQGFWQHAFPRPDEDLRSHLVTPEESLRSGESAVATARAMGRSDLESAALDAVAGCYIPRGFYAAARPYTRRRLELIGDLNDLWEIGDTYAMQGWVEFHLGDYRTAERWCSEGYERTVEEAPSLALQCLRWRSVARFRLGDWGGVRRDLALVRDLLGEEREDPPDYVSPAYAVAALVHEYRGEHVAADAVLDVLTGHYERRSVDDRDPLPLSQWAEFVAPILARRGLRTDARRLLARTRWRRRARLGLLMESWLEVAAETHNWEDAARLLERARGIAAESGSASLAVAADAFEGRMGAEAGDLERAIALLESAVSGFDRIGAEWDAARTRVTLAQTLDLAGFVERAAAVVAACLPVLERLGARRETDAVREIVEA